MISDLNLEFERELPKAEELKKEICISKELREKKKIRDNEIANVFKGISDKVILIIGPCSADKIDSVLEYTQKMASIQEQVKDKIIIVPRIFTGKPRTNGIGYKGMVHHPNPNEMGNIFKGIRSMRILHKRVIEETGFYCADEILYPNCYSYISDLISYAVIGARSSENQEHRLLASGLRIPVGMKNPTSGNITTMLYSIKTAQSSQNYIYNGFEVKSKGNDLVHAVLRGGINKFGMNEPNYHYEDLRDLCKLYNNDIYKNPAVLIDTNHSNSEKQYIQQIRIVNEVLNTMKYDNKIKKMIKGFIIESYLEDGCQNIQEKIYGKSITDPCLGIKKTRDLIFSIYSQI